MSINPSDVIATVVAKRDTTPYSTITNEDGDFLLSGLPAGTYNVTITPPLSLLPVTIAGTVVTVVASTDVGVIEF